MNIAVFCSANELPREYSTPAKEFASLIGTNNHTLIWGGSNKGMMRDIADSASLTGGKLIGVSMESLKEHARPDADAMHIESDLAARKAKIINLADVFVALPGGIGTLDELTHILEMMKHDQIEPPLYILNTSGFYSSLLKQFKTMEKLGFFTRPTDEIVKVSENPKHLYELIT